MPKPALELGACRIVNIKVGRVGGFSEEQCGYVSISQHHIVSPTHRKMDQDLVPFNWSDAAPCRSPASARWMRMQRDTTSRAGGCSFRKISTRWT